MGTRRVVCCLLLSLLLGLAFVEPAYGAGEADTGGYGALRLQGTHGYSILVLAGSKQGFRHGEVLFLVGRKGEAAIYLAPAKVTATTIDAKLGGVGRISVEFKPRGKRREMHPSCAPTVKIPFQPGEWVGTIDFEGEEGFTRAEASSAAEAITPFIQAGCGTVTEGEEWGPGLPGARLVARAATSKRAIFLQANANRPGGRLRLTAAIEERKRGLVVSREVEGRYPGSGFGFDPALRSAILRPPSPFSGYARFRRNAKPRNQWTGNLSVDFPGRSTVSLTGARFHAGLAHARFTREVRVDERPSGGELRALGDFANQWLTNSSRSIGGLPALLRRSMGS
jgi:hypothetical protein